MSLAFLFPGQGTQRPDMLKSLPDSPAATRVVAEASCITGDLDVPGGHTSTTEVQVALLVSGVASARALTVDAGLTPQFVAGHSAGAFAAAVTAGILTLSEALDAVEMRGRLMEQACAQREWGMSVLNGLPIRRAAEIARAVNTQDDPVWLANINSATQTVFSGTATGLARAADASRHAGARSWERLDIEVASHCPVQQGTARRLTAHLARLPRRRATAGYLTNRTGRVVMSAETILDDLAQSVAHPVRWYDGARLLGELGVTCAIETPPGHVLSGLFATAAPTVAALSLQDDALPVVVHRAREALRSRAARDTRRPTTGH